MDWNGIREWVTAEGTGHWFFVAFPIMLLCLLIILRGRRVRFLIPSLLITVVIVNPVFYKYWTDLSLYAYWRILWIIPVIPVTASVIPMITEKIQRPWGKSLAAVAGIGAVVLSGTLLYKGPGGRFTAAANAAKLPDSVVRIADRLLDGPEESEGGPGTVRIVAQHPLGVYMRQYSGEIDQLYGRDLDGYILGAKAEARNVHNALSDGNMTAVATAMANDQYEYLIVSADKEEALSGPEYEVVDEAAGYGIYRAHGKPTVEKVRNELGQVVRVTTVDENGKPVNGESGYATVEWQYDAAGNLTAEEYLDGSGNLVNNINGYAQDQWEYDSGKNIVVQRFLNADGELVVTGAGYAEVHRNYDGKHLIREEYYGADGKPMMQPAGHMAIRQTWDGDTLVSREYLNASGEPINRTDGYARATWETEGSCTSVKFYAADGTEIPVTGLNLARDVKGNPDGWTNWMIPTYNAVNSCQNIGSVNLGTKAEGDVYACTVEIEFRDVRATEGQTLRFWTQGAQDGSWNTGNVWNGNLVNLTDVPADGICMFTSTVAVSGSMADISNFDIGFRCDYWASGMYRVRNVRIERGDQRSEWKPGI